jgi:hypothetical protein
VEENLNRLDKALDTTSNAPDEALETPSNDLIVADEKLEKYRVKPK